MAAMFMTASPDPVWVHRSKRGAIGGIHGAAARFRLKALLFQSVTFSMNAVIGSRAAVFRPPPRGGRNRFRLSLRFASDGEKYFVCLLAKIQKSTRCDWHGY
jgi:hypothetical protein